MAFLNFRRKITETYKATRENYAIHYNRKKLIRDYSWLPLTKISVFIGPE